MVVPPWARANHIPNAASALALRSFAAIAVAYILSGTVTAVSIKWGGTLELAGRDGVVSAWDHPFCQTFLMFVCEFFCLVYFTATRGDVKNTLVPPLTETPRLAIYVLSTICDLLSTTMDRVGRGYTTLSAYQALRGGIILFTAIFARVFLKRRFLFHQYFGIALVVAGLAIVGVPAVVFGNKEEERAAPNPPLGNTIIVCAQLFAAAQNILEEYLFATYSTVPVKLVGIEGLVGVVMMIVLLFMMALNGGQPDDVWDWSLQATSSWKPIASLSMFVLAVPFFNTAGTSLTKYVSATTRLAIGSLRNILVWGVSIMFFGEPFKWLQLTEFALLIAGVAVFQRIIDLPHAMLRLAEDDDDMRTIVGESGCFAPGALDDDDGDLLGEVAPYSGEKAPNNLLGATNEEDGLVTMARQPTYGTVDN